MEYLNTLAKDKLSGAILHIDKVPNGDKCNCVCISCGNNLQARQGDIRQHHFKHISGNECSPETILHQLSKQILLEHRIFNLPSNEGYFNYDNVQEEQWMGNHKPDIVLTGIDKIIHVEIAVTSFIKESKYQKIKLADLNTVEIDLSNLRRDCEYDDLKKIIIHETANKKIIHWKGEFTDVPLEKDETFQWIGAIGLFFFIAWIIKKFRK